MRTAESYRHVHNDDDHKTVSKCYAGAAIYKSVLKKPYILYFFKVNNYIQIFLLLCDKQLSVKKIINTKSVYKLSLVLSKYLNNKGSLNPSALM